MFVPVKSPPFRITRTLATVLLLLTASCGWQLRGLEPIPESLKRVELNLQNPQDEFSRALRRTLVASGFELVPDDSGDRVILQVGTVRNERRAISTTDLGKAAEYELVSRLDYGVLDSAGQPIAGPDSILTEKIYVFDQNNVASAAREEALLREEMQRELIQQLLRRFKAIKLPETPVE